MIVKCQFIQTDKPIVSDRLVQCDSLKNEMLPVKALFLQQLFLCCSTFKHFKDRCISEPIRHISSHFRLLRHFSITW